MLRSVNSVSTCGYCLIQTVIKYPLNHGVSLLLSTPIITLYLYNVNHKVPGFIGRQRFQVSLEAACNWGMQHA